MHVTTRTPFAMTRLRLCRLREAMCYLLITETPCTLTVRKRKLLDICEHEPLRRRHVGVETTVEACEEPK